MRDVGRFELGGRRTLGEPSVDREQAVGDQVDVVDLLDVGRLSAPISRRSDGALDERPERVDQRLLGRRDDRDAAARSPRALCSTVSSSRWATTGFPSAIASSAKTPCQPAFSWSTTMSALA